MPGSSMMTMDMPGNPQSAQVGADCLDDCFQSLGRYLRVTPLILYVHRHLLLFLLCPVAGISGYLIR